jgi:hypothetical protein
MAVTFRAMYGDPSWLFDATLASDTGWSAAYPLSNIKSLPLRRPARTAGLALAQTRFTATFSAFRATQLVGFVRHNLTLDAKARVRYYEDTALTIEVYDSGWQDVWPQVYELGDVEWEDPQFWNGKYSSLEIAGYNPLFRDIADKIYRIKGARFEFDDQLNPAGFLSFGYFDIAKGEQLPVNPEYGSQDGPRSRTKRIETDAGPHFRRQQQARAFQGTVTHVPRNWRKRKGGEMKRRNDVDVPFLWCLSAIKSPDSLRDDMLVRNAALDLSTYAGTDVDTFPISLEEVIL